MLIHAAPATGRAIDLPKPYLLFVGDARSAGFAKTAFGLKDWAAESCVGECASSPEAVSTGLPRMAPREACARGAKSIVIGVAAVGGAIAQGWLPVLVEALEAGLDIVSGMHSRLGDVPALEAAVARTGRRFFDVRRPPPDIPVASGRRRTGKRLLTVGTDCALGKKYTALSLSRAFVSRGIDAQFRATGQTGIMIAGGGIPIDAVVGDFAAGAAEILSPDADDAHWDIIEGQGSLFHPAYAGVSLALLHGSQPDVIVLCHEPARTRVIGYPDYALPTVEAAIALNLALGARTNGAIRCAGVSVNTSGMAESEAAALIGEMERTLRLPVADPIRGGEPFRRLVDACLDRPASPSGREVR